MVLTKTTGRNVVRRQYVPTSSGKSTAQPDVRDRVAGISAWSDPKLDPAEWISKQSKYFVKHPDSRERNPAWVRGR
jgi:hypothetical protein